MESNVIPLPTALEVNVNRFVQELSQRQPGWNGSWVTLSATDRGGLIRALMADYLRDMGQGTDWAAAGNRAQFVMASLYHDFAPLPEPGIKEVDWWLKCAFQPEGFEFTLRRPTPQTLPSLPPLALPELPDAIRPPLELTPEGRSVLAYSAARSPARAPLELLADEDLSGIVETLGQVMRLEGREVLMFAAAMMVVWKACQVSGVVSGGALYRDVHNPSLPTVRRGDVRLAFARIGPEMTQAMEESPDGGAYLLM